MSFLPWFALAHMTPLGASFVYLVVLLNTRSNGVIMVDRIIDATFGKVTRMIPTKNLQPISWCVVALGGITGNICEKMGLEIFNIERIFIFLSFCPIFHLFSKRLLDENTLESNYNNNTRKVLSVETLDEPPIDVDDFGMLNSFIQDDDYLDTIMLQGFIKEREFLDDKDKMAPPKLPWTIDQGKHTEVLARPKKIIKQHNYNDSDWVHIEKNEIEKFPLDLETRTPKFKETGHKVFNNITNDTTNELDFIQMEELDKHVKQSSVGVYSNSEHHPSSQVHQVQGRGFKNLWQESIISNILKQPTIMQPMLWILITQLVSPSLSSIMLCYRFDDLQIESTLLRPSPMITWGGLMLSTFLFNHYLKHIPIQKAKLDN